MNVRKVTMFQIEMTATELATLARSVDHSISSMNDAERIVAEEFMEASEIVHERQGPL